MSQIEIDAKADAEQLDDQTAALRHQLVELDVDGVDRPRTEEPPAGARAGEVAELGTLLVTVAPTVLGAVVEAIRSWLSRRRRGATLRLGDDVIETTRASSERQDELIAAFLARHADG
jgi:hypothetical protein